MPTDALLAQRVTEAWVRWASDSSDADLSDGDLASLRSLLLAEQARAILHDNRIRRGRRPTMTLLQAQLTGFLERAGYEVEDEMPFGPYRVDCYIESLHLAFEADGPFHDPEHDRKRDAWLLEHCALPVVRFTSEEIGGLCEA